LFDQNFYAEDFKALLSREPIVGSGNGQAYFRVAKRPEQGNEIRAGANFVRSRVRHHSFSEVFDCQQDSLVPGNSSLVKNGGNDGF
jgi:hypothetical protein